MFAIMSSVWTSIRQDATRRASKRQCQCRRRGLVEPGRGGRKVSSAEHAHTQAGKPRGWGCQCHHSLGVWARDCCSRPPWSPLHCALTHAGAVPTPVVPQIQACHHHRVPPREPLDGDKPPPTACTGALPPRRCAPIRVVSRNVANPQPPEDRGLGSDGSPHPERRFASPFRGSPCERPQREQNAPRRGP